jgi:TRAP-type C4-dicarboxylate transport system permease small subunit
MQKESMHKTSSCGAASVTLNDLSACEPEDEHEDLGERQLGRQSARLPSGWQSMDRALVHLTRHVLFVIGSAFTLLIVSEVVLRYAFSHSVWFANSLSKLLLVWFFLLGAGIALRQGAHMGFDSIATRLTPRNRRKLMLLAHAIGILFFFEMLWASIYALGPALNQTDPGLDISLGWLVSSIPAGFALLLYHMVVIMFLEWRGHLAGSERP